MSSIGNSSDQRVDSGAVARRAALPSNFQTRYQGPSVDKPHQVATQVMENIQNSSSSSKTPTLTNTTFTVVGEPDDAGEGSVGQQESATVSTSDEEWHPLDRENESEESTINLSTSEETSHADEAKSVATKESTLSSGLKAAGSALKSAFAATLSKVKEYAPTVIMLIGFTCLVGGLALSFTGFGLGPGLGIAALGALLIFGGSQMQKSRAAHAEEQKAVESEPFAYNDINRVSSSGMSSNSSHVEDQDEDGDETVELGNVSDYSSAKTQAKDYRSQQELESSSYDSSENEFISTHSKVAESEKKEDVKKEDERKIELEKWLNEE